MLSVNKPRHYGWRWKGSLKCQPLICLYVCVRLCHSWMSVKNAIIKLSPLATLFNPLGRVFTICLQTMPRNTFAFCLPIRVYQALSVSGCIFRVQWTIYGCFREQWWWTSCHSCNEVVNQMAQICFAFTSEMKLWWLLAYGYHLAIIRLSGSDRFTK